jgi:uncharacterized protein YdaU (DUF1376 family)
MSSRPWMPLYVADYLADTDHLTLAQHGAYLLLIMHYWRHGCLPENDEIIAKILRISRKQLPSIWLALAPFFDENRRHKRIDIELEKHEIIKTKRQISGRIGGLRRGNKSSMNRIVNAAIAKQTGNQSQSHIETLTSERVRAPTNGSEESGLPTKEAGKQSPFGSGRSLDQIVRDKGWTAEEPPITSKLLA